MFRSPSPASPDGSLIESVRRMTAAAARYASARSQLFVHEAGQARRHVVQMAALGIVVGVFGVLGYIALVGALTAWMAQAWWDGRWVPALAVTGGIHLAAAIACATAIHRIWKNRGFFPATRREFKEDKKWLTTNESTK